MAKSVLPVAMNIFAPDEGNMHMMEEICTPAQKERWLRPLAAGEPVSAAAAVVLAADALAVANALWQAQTGLFRVMPGASDRAIVRLRGTAKAFALDWPAAMALSEFEKRLNPSDPREAAFLMAARRGGGGEDSADRAELVEG